MQTVELPTDLHNHVLVSIGDRIMLYRVQPEERDYFAIRGLTITDPFGKYSQQDTLDWLDLLELSHDADHALHVFLWILRKAGAHLAPDKRFGMRLYANYGEKHGWFDSREKWDEAAALMLVPKREMLKELLKKVKDRRDKRGIY